MGIEFMMMMLMLLSCLFAETAGCVLRRGVACGRGEGGQRTGSSKKQKLGWIAGRCALFLGHGNGDNNNNDTAALVANNNNSMTRRDNHNDNVALVVFMATNATFLPFHAYFLPDHSSSNEDQQTCV